MKTGLKNQEGKYDNGPFNFTLYNHVMRHLTAKGGGSVSSAANAKIAGAACDVYARTVFLPADRFLRLINFIVSPHILEPMTRALRAGKYLRMLRAWRNATR
jgi:hypothetical protein